MANSIDSRTATVLTYDQIKHLQEVFLEKPLISSLVWPPPKLEEFFYWYVGHDPYNSADNHAFMQRLTDE